MAASTEEQLIKRMRDRGFSQDRINNVLQKRQTKMSSPTNNKSALQNVIPSGIQAAKDIGAGVANVFNPNVEKNTVAQLGKAAFGGIGLAADKLTGIKTPDIGGSKEMASRIGSFYKDRYGSIDAAKETFRTDPVGFLMDASAVFTGGAGAVGAGAKAAGLSKVASGAAKAAKIGQLADPFSAATKITKGVAGKIAGRGKKAEQLTEAGNLAKQQESVIKTAETRKPLRRLAESTEARIINLDKGAAKKFKQRFGVEAEQYMLDSEFSGLSNVEKKELAKFNYKKSKQKVQNIVQSIKTPITDPVIPDLFKAMKADIKAASRDSEIFNVLSKETVSDKVDNIINKSNQGSLSASDLQTFREFMDETPVISGYTSTGSAKTTELAEKLQFMRDKIKTSIENEVKVKTNQNIKDLNKQTAINKSLELGLEDAIRTDKKKPAIKDFEVLMLASAIGGSVFAGAPAAGVAVTLGYGAVKALTNSTKTMSKLAKTLNKISGKQVKNPNPELMAQIMGAAENALPNNAKHIIKEGIQKINKTGKVDKDFEKVLKSLFKKVAKTKKAGFQAGRILEQENENENQIDSPFNN